MTFQKAELIELDDFKAPQGYEIFYYPVFDGVKIRVCIWNKQSNLGTIILQSGRTEFIEKYYEVVKEFIDRGYCVAMFDWRGQGLSGRLSSDPFIGHVNKFSDYEIEFEEILKNVYIDKCPKPWIGMGHSMGGCLVASLASQKPDIFDAIILCAPMLSIKMPKLLELTILAIGELSKIGFRDKAFPTPDWKNRKGWHEIPFEENVVTSDLARYKRSGDLIKKNEKLAVGALSIGWGHESIKKTRNLYKSNWTKLITIPSLLLNASKDKLVNVIKNQEMCSKIKNISIANIKGEHELLMEKDSIRNETWKEIDKFLETL